MNRKRNAGLLALSTVLLGGCLATVVKWKNQIETTPNAFHHVLTNTDGNAVHVYVQNNALQMSTYDPEGALLATQADPHTFNTAARTLDLVDGRLLVQGSTLATTYVVDGNTAVVAPLDSSQLPEGSADWALTGITPALSSQVAAYGSRSVDGNPQAWIIVWNVSSQTFAVVDIPGVSTIDAVFSNENLIVQGRHGEERWVITMDASLNELGRFVLTAEEESLIGDSLGRPTFINVTTKNVITRLPDGALDWEFVNSEYTYIRGQSVGPDGSILLWGDHSNYSLFSFRTDNAHFLRITPEGALAYHYLAGKDDMAKIDYRNIKQFEDGSVQLSVQGLGGELAGLLLIDGVWGVPYRTTKEILHDFVSATGVKKRWMREPIRVESISRTSAWLIEVVSQSGGHCNNRDVFNVDKQHLISVSELCGASAPTVVVSYY